jgi:hypothetical protein
LSAYTIEVRGPAGDWREVATVPAFSYSTDWVTYSPPVQADAIRLRLPATRSGGKNPQLADLVVRPAVG